MDMSTASAAAFGPLYAVPDSWDDCDAEALSEAARAATLAQNLAGATRLAAAHALVAHMTREAESAEAAEAHPAFARLDPHDRARDHLCAAMSLTCWHARRLVTAGVQIHTRLPLLRKAVGRGLVPEQLAIDVACRLAEVPAAILRGVESEVVGRLCRDLNDGHRPGARAVNAAVEAAVERHDPNAAQDAVDAASGTRTVRFRPERHGMVSMWARLPLSDAEKLRRRIEAVARAAADAGHPRTLDQLRADALSALGDPTTDDIGGALRDVVGDPERGGHPPPDTASADPAAASASPGLSPAPSPAPSPIRVTIISAVARGLPNRVEFVRGAYSSFDWLCQELLEAGDARIRFEKVDPAPGAIDDPDTALRYRIHPALAERIRLRDGTCRHPGCTVDAKYCDVDHVIAFDHHRPELGGPTLEWNLICLCRRHHREKTFGRSAYRPGPLGELLIITDTGHEHRTRPTGPLAQARDQLLEHRWRRRIDAMICDDGLLANPPGADRPPA